MLVIPTIRDSRGHGSSRNFGGDEENWREWTMAVPDFQSMFLPFLRFASDGVEHHISDVINHIAETFNLSKEDREELLPCGSQRRLNNRVGWARTHLKYAGLIKYVRRGIFEITERGREPSHKKSSWSTAIVWPNL